MTVLTVVQNLSGIYSKKEKKPTMVNFMKLIHRNLRNKIPFFQHYFMAFMTVLHEYPIVRGFSIFFAELISREKLFIELLFTKCFPDAVCK